MTKLPSSGLFNSIVGTEENKIFAIRLDNFEIENGQLVYRNAIKRQFEIIKNLNASLELKSLAGPMRSLGSAVVRGVPVSFSAATGTVIQGRTLPVNVSLKMASGEVNIQFSGALTRLNHDPRLRGTFDFVGKNLTKSISAFCQ